MVAERSEPARDMRAHRVAFDLWPVIVAAAVVALDQLSKALVIGALGPPEAGKTKSIIPKLLDIRHDQNTGAAFSLFQGRSTPPLLIGLIVLGMLIYYYRALPQHNPVLRLAVGAVLGGA